MNSGDAVTDKAKAADRKALFILTNKLSLEELEQFCKFVWAAERRKMLDVSISRISTLLKLDCNEQFETLILATAGRYLLTDAECSAQTGHNVFSVKKNITRVRFF